VVGPVHPVPAFAIPARAVAAFAVAAHDGTVTAPDRRSSQPRTSLGD
jgi:hypothetical protein